MPTSDEINRRVKEADTPRTEKRSQVCTRIAELAEQRATQAAQLAETEHQLGEILADAGEVITIDEVARITEVPATDLDQWLAGRKTVRGKRKQSTGGGRSRKHDQHQDTAATTPADVETPTPREPAASPDGRARVAAGVS